MVNTIMLPVTIMYKPMITAATIYIDDTVYTDTTVHTPFFLHYINRKLAEFSLF